MGKKGLKVCPSCGEEFSGRRKYCTYKCSFPAMGDAAIQLHERKGPIYEKWKARWEAATGLTMKGGK